MGLDYIFPTNELLGNMVSADQPAMKTIFNVDEEHQLATENWLKNYTTNTDTALDYLSKVTLRQTFDGMINMYRLVGGALCAILALIGILNFINSITTSILSRYREIAMLQSVGMTGRQVKQMLIYEGIGYSILGLFRFSDTVRCGKSNGHSNDWCGINLFYMAFYLASGISLYYPSDPHYSHCSFGLL
ncbi:MAG: ABC transporter permease [Lachnospiraceae bacterium]